MPNTREKLVELLSQVQYLGGLEEKIADHLIANGVTVQDGEDKNVPTKWISVNDRLPEKDGKYLVHRLIFGGVGTMSVLGFATDGENVSTYDLAKEKNVWYEYDSDYGYISLADVTHWMPLPPMPKGE